MGSDVNQIVHLSLRRAVALFALTLVTACAGREPAAHGETSALTAFLESVYEQRIARSPELQTRLGIKRDYDSWDQRTDVAAEAAAKAERQALAGMQHRFPIAELGPQDQLNFRLYEYEAEELARRHPWRHHNYAIDHRNGAHSYAPATLINSHTIDSVADAEAYIARVHALSSLLEQVVGQLRVASAKGIVPPELVFEPAIAASKNVLRGAPFEAEANDSTLRADFRAKLNGLELAAAERSRLHASLDSALLDSAAPAYQRFIDALGLLKSRADGNKGVWALPDGRAFYAQQLRRHTTTRLSADEIHAIGLREVDRIHEEMRAIMRTVGFAGDLQAFFEFTRTDPQFYYSNDETGRDQYLREATAFIDAMRERLPELFTVFPKTTLRVQRVEPFREQSAGRAFYGRPSADGSRPGIYYANLYQMERMPTYQMQALAYHEGIPGHHMQIAIQQELEGVPRFRLFGRVTAFSEGWGLYSEWLPTEIGAYTNPYSDFGRLAMELWRACRLVVDTGLHSRRWSREEAILYLLDNTPNPAGDIASSVDRYLVNPGQATAYMIGKLKIMELRRKAESALGERFDVRRFHDAVLANGPLPLEILERQIIAFIAAEQQVN